MLPLQPFHRLVKVFGQYLTAYELALFLVARYRC